MNGSNIKEGKIVKIISNLYTVKVADNYYECRARGKFRHENLTPVVGDIVEVDISENYITNIKERKNELSRPLISNVDVALIITSIKKPDLSMLLLDKLILNIKKENIEPVICITKMDLVPLLKRKSYKKLFKYYESVGIKVFYNNNLNP